MKVWTWAAALLAIVGVGLVGWRARDMLGPKPAPISERAGMSVIRPALAPVRPVTRPATFLVAVETSKSAVAMSDDDWRRAYPAFAHAPYESSGFAAVALPWRHAATPDAGGDDPAVARALAFLLGYDLQWSPAARPVAPPFVVFRHSGELPAEAAADAYDAKAVAALVDRWHATHAIGGVLVRGKDGYVATLQIFGRDGKPLHEAAFEKPQGIFPLLGDISCESLRFFGTPPSDVLIARLHADRCKNTGSLSNLGKASVAKEQSPAEFGLYQTILKADPGFAEVRMWLATQRRMIDGDPEAYAADQAEVLQASPHVAALADFDPAAASSDAERKLKRWIDAAETLAGREHPIVIRWRLRQAQISGATPGGVDRDTFRRLQSVASKYPSNWPLLTALVDAMRHEEDDYRIVAATAYDPELVASIALAGLFDPATGDDRGHAWLWVARAAHALGRPQHVLAAIARFDQTPASQGRRRGTAGSGLWEADALMQTGKFKEAAEAYSALIRRGVNRPTEIDAAICAVLAGEPDVIDRLAASPQVNFQSALFFKGCTAYLAGKPVSRADFSSMVPGYGEILIAEGQLAAGGLTRDQPPSVWTQWVDKSWTAVEDPLTWKLLDRYYRAVPTLPYAAAFYEAAEWERPGDPQVAEAVALWRKLGGDRSLPTVDALVANIDLPAWGTGARMPDWAVVARVRRDLDEGRHADAARLAKAFLQRKTPNLPRATWLSRRVESGSSPSTTAPITRR